MINKYLIYRSIRLKCLKRSYRVYFQTRSGSPPEPPGLGSRWRAARLEPAPFSDFDLCSQAVCFAVAAAPYPKRASQPLAT
jgi:hypothetical protein